jgi:uncharacterized protein
MPAKVFMAAMVFLTSCVHAQPGLIAPIHATSSELGTSSHSVVAVAQSSTQAHSTSHRTTVVQTALQAIINGDFAAAAEYFDDDSGVQPQTIATIWQAKTLSLGDNRGISVVNTSRQDGIDIAIVNVNFARGVLQCFATVNTQSNRIGSMFFTTPAAAARYVDATRFTERALDIGAAPYLLPSTLTIPNGAGPFPAVVLIHGSGPNDRDETVGANKMFKDIAEGLASNGIAVLRYDKRTFRYGDQLDNSITIDGEVVDDAVAAVQLLMSQPHVDARRVVVIGHSLGGLLAPEIANRAKGVSGLVLLAPPARPPWDIVLAQMRYLHAPRKSLAAVERSVTLINMGLGDGTSILDIPFAYWNDWSKRDGVAQARAFGKPVLVLRGSCDYQVIDQDFDIWRRGLSNTKSIFTMVPDLNHLMMPCHGNRGPAQYKVPSHVDDSVIATMVAFVRSH